jgi:hypothetical protein
MNGPNAFLEIVFASCMGAAFLCANVACMLILIKALGILSIRQSVVIATLALIVGTILAARTLQLHSAGSLALAVFSFLIAMLNFTFLGYLFSSLSQVTYWEL